MKKQLGFFFFCALLTATKGLSEGPGRVWQENIRKGLPALTSYLFMLMAHGCPEGSLAQAVCLGITAF